MADLFAMMFSAGGRAAGYRTIVSAACAISRLATDEAEA
jgi:hypothetical protein